MNVGILPLAIATIGAAYAALVLRGSRRRDNLVFGLLVLTDATMTAWRGINVMTGGSIVSRGVMIPCSVGTIAMSLLTLEFIVAFPRRRPMSWRWRGAMVAWAGAAIALAPRRGGGPWGPNTLLELGFFLPMTLLIFAVSYRSYRRATQRDVRIVLATLAFRWVCGFGAYFVAPLLGVFEQSVWAETTVATMIGFAVIGTAVLRTELFSLRSSAAEVVTIATIALIVMLAAGASVTAVLAYVPVGRLQQLALFGATLVPLALTAAGFAMYPRVERRVLAPLDERRARRLHVQGDPIPADASAAIAEATARISSFGDGAKVRWLHAPELPAALAEALRDGDPRRNDTQPELPAGFIVPALGAEGSLVGAFYIDGGTIDRDTYLVTRDLAARVALAVERAQAVSALDEARHLAALGQFAAAIAHDIRTPLTSISLNVQILRRKLQLSDDDREHLDIALEELTRLDRSVAEILDFAKPVKLASEAIDVGELIEAAAKGLSPVLFERGVRLEWSPSADLTVHGDAQRLRQVLVNLVDNAADASKPGAAITLRATAADDQISIEIEDRGRGIGAADLSRIFEPFFTTRPDGTGLGLAICHKLVRAHGGDIRVRSIPGEGSTFTVVLPAA